MDHHRFNPRCRFFNSLEYGSVELILLLLVHPPVETPTWTERIIALIMTRALTKPKTGLAGVALDGVLPALNVAIEGLRSKPRNGDLKFDLYSSLFQVTGPS